MTLFLLWEEYKGTHPTGYECSHFCGLYRQWRGKLPVWMRQTHRAGEKLFVDYAGMTMGVRSGKTGEVRQAQIFVATLGASSYTYAEATWSQTLPDFVMSHVRAFEFFGGCPELVVPDNLRSGVSRPCRYDPDTNPTYAEMAAHYGTAIMPTRVAKPRSHRAHAEWTPERITRWVGKAGCATAEVANQIMASRPHPEQGFRACMGLKRLGEYLGTDRLEAACQRALLIQSPSYKSVKSILEKGLDQQPLPEVPPQTPSIEHENVRGADYYH